MNWSRTLPPEKTFPHDGMDLVPRATCLHLPLPPRLHEGQRAPWLHEAPLARVMSIQSSCF